MWKLTENKDWRALEKQFSWVEDMQYVNQHKLHHAEGNVAIHTQMVLSQLSSFSEFKKLSPIDQEIIWTAALMHDVEKRSTSVDEGNGIIRTPNHAKRGEKVVREILYKNIETPFHIRETIASLVRLHGLPLWIMEKEDEQKEIIKASWRVQLEKLYLLSLADVRGRICGDEQDLLDRLDLFKTLSIEQNCWRHPKMFLSNTAAYHYFKTEGSYVDYVPFDCFKCKVILMSGLPGMGKDSYIKSLDKDLPIISLDALRRKYKASPMDKSATGKIVHEAKDLAKNYLRKGQDFIWNATNITTLVRKQLIDMFADYGAYTQIVYLERPFSIWRSQNRNREYAVPDAVLEKMFFNLDIPQKWEAHEVLYDV